MNIAQPLRKLMDERNLSNSKLAREVGVHTSTVSNWLDGKEVKAENLTALCTYFNCSLDYLAGKMEETKKAPTQKGEREIDDRKMKAAFLGRIFLTAARVCGICQKNKKSEIAIKNRTLQLQIADEIADEIPPPFLRAGIFI